MDNANLIITRENSRVLVTNQQGVTLILDNEELLGKTNEEITAYCSRLNSFNSIRKRGDSDARRN